jgi:serine/threonine-protein kinase RsbW
VGELVFGEVISNVVRHAPGLAEVELSTTPRGVEMSVADRGEGFTAQPLAAAPLAESGRGLQLVRALADEVTIGTNPHGGTTVHVTWRTFGAQREDVLPS